MISKNHHYCARMLIHACEFSESADLLLAMDHKEMRLEVSERYFTPAIVCISFSYELYLKVLLLYYEIDIAKTHKLSDLYDKLPDETRNKIKFDVAILKELSNYFVDKRYLYENNEEIIFTKVDSIVNLRYLLREEACQTVHSMTWLEYRDKSQWRGKKTARAEEKK